MWMVVSLKVTGNKREKVRGRGRKVQVAIYTELYMSYGTTGGDAGWATECTSLKFRGEARAGSINQRLCLHVLLSWIRDWEVEARK